MVDGVCLFNGVWGKISNVRVSTSVAVLHKKYTLCVPEMGWAFVYMSMCVAILQFNAVSAHVLLCCPMADYDIKCLWALISDSPKVRAISYSRWSLFNGALTDAQ